MARKTNWDATAHTFEKSITYQDVLDMLKDMDGVDQENIICEVLCNASDDVINAVKKWLAE